MDELIPRAGDRLLYVVIRPGLIRMRKVPEQHIIDGNSARRLVTRDIDLVNARVALPRLPAVKKTLRIGIGPKSPRIDRQARDIAEQYRPIVSQFEPARDVKQRVVKQPRGVV